MRVCPKCREVYEDYVRTCADCDVELVFEEEAAEPVGAAGAWRELSPEEDALDLFPLRGELAAREALSALGGHGVKAELGLVDLRSRGASLFSRTVLAVRVPRDDVYRALEALVTEAPEALPGPVLKELWRSLAAEIPQLKPGLPPMLGEPLEVLLRGGEDVVPALVRGYLEGGQLGSRCHYVLTHMQADAEPAVLSAVTSACEAGDGEALARLGLLSRDLAGERTVAALRSLVAGASPPARQLVAWLLGYIPLMSAVRLLVEMLGDADLEVRRQAIGTLTDLVGEDLGYDAEADETDRQRAVAAWQGHLQWAAQVAGGEREPGSLGPEEET